METIVLFWYLLCAGSDCRVEPFAVSREALAIISCESGADHAQRDSYENQYTAFRRLWSDGTGWRHWKSSQACWSQWMVVIDGRAVWQ